MPRRVAGERMAIRKVNLGCGNDARPGYVNVDIAPLPGVEVVADLSHPLWPFTDNAFEEILLINVLEHLPDVVRPVEELWRISKPGAKIHVRVPYWNCYQSAADPTHRHRFHQSTFDFFDPGRQGNRQRPYYSDARFKIQCVDYWLPLLPTGRGWVRVRNRLLKGILAALATYLNNVIWVLEFELAALK